MFEFEKKILLREPEYFVLMAVMCKNMPSVSQVNHYFDTADFAMNKNGVTCRIRYKNGKYTAAVKRHGENGADGSVESTCPAKSALDADAFRGMGVQYQGCLTTERTVAFRDEFCEMVFDRNMYLSHTDYELEVEYREGCEEHVWKLLRHVADILLSVGLIASTEAFFARVGKSKNKSSRFFSRKKRHGGWSVKKE